MDSAGDSSRAANMEALMAKAPKVTEPDVDADAPPARTGRRTVCLVVTLVHDGVEHPPGTLVEVDDAEADRLERLFETVEPL
jgi:hypothetical protein